MHLPLPAVLLQVALLTAFQGGQQRPNPAQVLTRAMEFHQSGAFQQAIEQYEIFLEIHPNSPDVRSNLGAAYVQVGRLGDAIDQYREALGLGGGRNTAAVRFNLALAYYKTAQMSAAIEELKRVLALQPQNKNAAIVLSDCYLKQEKYQEIVELLAVFEEDQEDLAVAYLLGTALIRLGEIDRGQVLIDRILRQGDSAEAHLMMGTAYMLARDVPNALKEFQRGVELNPDLPSANALLAKTLREMGRIEESIPYFEKELEINPNDFDSLLHLGVHRYKRQQRYREALDYFDRALKIRPGALEVRFQIALVYVLLDRIREALEIIEAVVAEAPAFLEGHVTLTRLYYRLKRYQDAQRHRAIVERLRAEQDAETVKRVPRRKPGPGRDGRDGG